MLGRAVDGVEPQRPRARIPDIVPRARRNDHREVILHPVLAPVDIDRTLAFLYAEELIAVLVDLLADLIAWLKGQV